MPRTLIILTPRQRFCTSALLPSLPLSQMKKTRAGSVANHVHRTTLERQANTSSVRLQSAILRQKEVQKAKAKIGAEVQKELAGKYMS